MNLDYYRAFIECVRTGNLTVAAKNLGYTQSGVSHIVAYLEAEFGFPLVIRSRSGIRLTYNGEQVVELMQEVLNYDNKLHYFAEEVTGLRFGRVRVGAIESVATQWLPMLIKQFNEIYPKIEFAIVVGDYTKVEELLLSEVIDCGFLSSATAKQVCFTPLKQDELLALLPHDHPLTDKNSLTLHEVSTIDFIVPGEGVNYDIGQIFKREGLQLKAKTSINADYTAIAMVRAGLGMTIMPELIVDSIKDAGAVMHLEPRYYRTIGIAHKNTPDLSPACKRFVHFVKTNKGDQ